MSIQPKFGFILYYVDDVEAARRFYVDILGLEVQRYHPTFVQFENFAIASDEAMNASREPEVYWVVPDAEAALVELARKAEIAMPLRQMPFGKVFAVKDPAGNSLYLIEFARERPSQAAGVQP
jgi:catechol 2,3-dioxygenase-like lactoylglutathione lyase family enzyme